MSGTRMRELRAAVMNSERMRSVMNPDRLRAAMNEDRVKAAFFTARITSATFVLAMMYRWDGHTHTHTPLSVENAVKPSQLVFQKSRKRLRSCTRAYTNAHAHMHTRTRAHTRIHAHTYIHTRRNAWTLVRDLQMHTAGTGSASGPRSRGGSSQ